MQVLRITDLHFVDEIFELSSKTKAGSVYRESWVVYSSYNQSRQASPQDIARAMAIVRNALAASNIGISIPALNSLTAGALK